MSNKGDQALSDLKDNIYQNTDEKVTINSIRSMSEQINCKSGFIKQREINKRLNELAPKLVKQVKKLS